MIFATDFLIMHFRQIDNLYIYTLPFCPGVCLFGGLYPINVKTAENFC